MVLPIALGTAIYVLWRTQQLLVFRWVEALGLMPAVSTARDALAGIGRALPAWVLYSLPDALWVYAGTAFYALVWNPGPGRPRLFWTSLPGVLALGGELGQALGAVPGTFCPIDMLLCALAWWAALTLNPAEKVTHEPQLAY
jgi:hypothetical protein